MGLKVYWDKVLKNTSENTSVSGLLFFNIDKSLILPTNIKTVATIDSDGGHITWVQDTTGKFYMIYEPFDIYARSSIEEIQWDTMREDMIENFLAHKLDEAIAKYLEVDMMC